jgi:hypothetical protein
MALPLMNVSTTVERHFTFLPQRRPFRRPSAGNGALAVAALISVAIPQPLSAKTHPAVRRMEPWSFRRGSFGAAPVCIVSGHGRPSVTVQFLADAKHYGEVGITAGSDNWSIKDGDVLGDISLVSSGAQLTGIPTAAAQGFFYSVDARQVSTFARSASDGFQLERAGETIAQLPGGNLATVIGKLIACAAELHAADPFAQPVYAPSADGADAQRASVEAVTVPPRPINLGPWMKAIEEDYFAGPLGGEDIELKHDRRNSTPASLRFKLTVDEQGRMVNCEVIASSGLGDWGNEFCSLAERYSLRFTPALSASGTPVRGEYVTSAVVARK